MDSDIDQRLGQLERSVRRFRCVAIVLAILFPATAAVMQKRDTVGSSQSQSLKPTEQAGVHQRPGTRRTIDDVRKEYDPPPQDYPARASAIPSPPRPPIKIVDAEVLVLVDREGNVRAELGVTPQNSACFKMYDTIGRPRLELAESGGATTIKLIDQSGTPLVHVRQTHNTAEVHLSDAANRQDLKLCSSFGKSGVYLSGTKSDRAVALELEQHGEPRLSIADGRTNAQYRSRGLHVGSDSGNLAFYLTPDKRAALSMSVSPPVSGQEGIELSTTPGTAQMSLTSLAHGAKALLHASEELASLSLKPKNKEAALSMSIRDRDEFADSRILMQSNDGQESIHLDLNHAGPRLHFFDKNGNSVFDAPK